MIKKDLYTPPQVELLEMDYADPVCQATSGTAGVPNYEVIDGSGITWE